MTVNGGKQMRINSWKSLGWWRWRVDHIVRGALGQSGALTASNSRHPVPPLLVMAPGTVDMTIANESDWQRFNMHFVAVSPSCRLLTRLRGPLELAGRPVSATRGLARCRLPGASTRPCPPRSATGAASACRRSRT